MKQTQQKGRFIVLLRGGMKPVQRSTDVYLVLYLQHVHQGRLI